MLGYGLNMALLEEMERNGVYKDLIGWDKCRKGAGYYAEEEERGLFICPSKMLMGDTPMRESSWHLCPSLEVAERGVINTI